MGEKINDLEVKLSRIGDYIRYGRRVKGYDRALSGAAAKSAIDRVQPNSVARQITLNWTGRGGVAPIAQTAKIHETHKLNDAQEIHRFSVTDMAGQTHHGHATFERGNLRRSTIFPNEKAAKDDVKETVWYAKKLNKIARKY